MPFPVSIGGVVRTPVDRADPKRMPTIAQHVTDMLGAAGASHVIQSGHAVQFSTGFFRGVGNRHVLVQLGTGTIEIEDGPLEMRVTYRASTVRMLVIVTAVLCVPAAVLVSMTQTSPALSDLPAWFPALGVGIAWLWVFGGNYWMTKTRFRRWLEQGVRHALQG